MTRLRKKRNFFAFHQTRWQPPMIERSFYNLQVRLNFWMPPHLSLSSNLQTDRYRLLWTRIFLSVTHRNTLVSDAPSAILPNANSQPLREGSRLTVFTVNPVRIAVPVFFAITLKVACSPALKRLWSHATSTSTALGEGSGSSFRFWFWQLWRNESRNSIVASVPFATHLRRNLKLKGFNVLEIGRISEFRQKVIYRDLFATGCCAVNLCQFRP